MTSRRTRDTGNSSPPDKNIATCMRGEGGSNNWTRKDSLSKIILKRAPLGIESVRIGTQTRLKMREKVRQNDALRSAS